MDTKELIKWLNSTMRDDMCKEYYLALDEIIERLKMYDHLMKKRLDKLNEKSFTLDNSGRVKLCPEDDGSKEIKETCKK